MAVLSLQPWKGRGQIGPFFVFWGPSLISMQDSCNGMVQSCGNTGAGPFSWTVVCRHLWPITMVFVLTLCVRLNANYLFMFTPLEQIIGSAAAQLVAERDVLMFMTVCSPILSMMTVKQGSNLVGEEFKRLIILLGSQIMNIYLWQIKLWMV